MNRRFILWCLLATLVVALPGAIRCGVHHHRFQQTFVRTTGHVTRVYLGHDFFRYEFSAAEQNWYGEAGDPPQATVRVGPGSPVEVFYCPDYPDTNALQPPPQGAGYVFGKASGYLIVPIFLVGFALVCIDRFLRRSIPEEHWPT